ncbi:hypothetical protein AOY20_03415 [Acinetobacter equi]|uniref:Uncharacterized protein n=1 Tax=Acinetobacter equi TaxID=1324350 RepID=A0A0N9VU37_9GAMM|nr:hypothetical protein AOY20_03415 [Acinetobacter equi]
MANNYAGNENNKRDILTFFLSLRTIFGQAFNESIFLEYIQSFSIEKIFMNHKNEQMKIHLLTLKTGYFSIK